MLLCEISGTNANNELYRSCRTMALNSENEETVLIPLEWGHYRHSDRSNTLGMRADFNADAQDP